MGQINKMRAFVRKDPENNRVELTEVDIPEVGANEMLVEVQAFGVGIHDRYFIHSNKH